MYNASYQKITHYWELGFRINDIAMFNSECKDKKDSSNNGFLGKKHMRLSGKQELLLQIRKSTALKIVGPRNETAKVLISK